MKVIIIDNNYHNERDGKRAAFTPADWQTVPNKSGPPQRDKVIKEAAHDQQTAGRLDGAIRGSKNCNSVGRLHDNRLHFAICLVSIRPLANGNLF